MSLPTRLVNLQREPMNLESHAPKVKFLSKPRDHKFSSEWYDLSVLEHFWMRGRLTAALRLLQSYGVSLASAKRVLDIGCGHGALRTQLESTTQWTVDCADLSMQALSSVRPGRGQIYYYDVCEEHADLIGKYDLIF